MPLIDLENHQSIYYENFPKEDFCEENVIFLHGIMAHSKNLQGFIKQFLSKVPNVSAIAFDIPNHGKSSNGNGPFDLMSISNKLIRALDKLPKFSAYHVVGHSYGGKLAVALGTSFPNVKSIWVLDSPLSAVLKPKPLAGDDNSALDVLVALKKIPWPLKSRKELVERLEAFEIQRSIALWMTTNLKETNKGLVLNFNPEEIALMLKSYLETDLWELALGYSGNFHLVKAEKSSRITSFERQKLLTQKENSQRWFHELPGAGHFLHMDNPVELCAMMQEFF